MQGHRETTFPELFSTEFSMRRGELVPAKTASEAESRQLNEREVQVRLSGGVRIPRMQRDYAQGRDDGPTGRVTRVRREFLEALHRALTGGVCSLNFVYGQFERPLEQAGVFDVALLPLDGQQRLTTLFLLHWYASRRDGRAADAGYLDRFSYATRYSSEEFCNFLCSITTLSPDAGEREFMGRSQVGVGTDGALLTGPAILSRFLANKAGFIESWRNDPTVAGMLVMLDAIHEWFAEVPDLWAELIGPRRPLRFHFLPLSAVGVDADEIFIKMNSRGLELTEFEYFKADLLKLLETNGWDDARLTELGTRIDGDWESTFWELAKHCRLDTGHLDPYLMRYANYLIDMLGFRSRRFGRGQRYTDPNSQPERYDPDRARAVLQPGGVWDQEAIRFFVAGFDCWTTATGPDGDGGIGMFFDGRFTGEFQAEGDPGAALRIRLFRRGGEVQLLADCAAGKNLSIPDRALLFSLIVHLQGLDGDSEQGASGADFSSRFRAIRNIAANMDSSVETLYLWLNAFPSVLAGATVTRDFGLVDVVRRVPESVVAEENFKLALAASGDVRLRDLHRIEEHDWLRGRVNVFCPAIADREVVDAAACGEQLLDRFARLGGVLVSLADAMKPGRDGFLRLALLLAVERGTYAAIKGQQELWGTSAGHPDALWRELFRRPDGHKHPGTSEALMALLEERALAPGVAVAEWLERFVGERQAAAAASRASSRADDTFTCDLRYYLLAYPETMLNFPGWPRDPQVRRGAPSGIVQSRGRGDRLAYLVNTAGNWFWDPFLLTVLARTDPDGALVPERRWRGSDLTARRVIVDDGTFAVRCRAAGYYLDAPEGVDLAIPGLEVVPASGAGVWIPEGRRLWLWPVRQEGGHDAEDRVTRGEALFASLRQEVARVCREMER